MKKLKVKIALMFGIACVATLLFAIPALACGNDHDYGKHGGFIHPTKAKSWFSYAWQEKYVEPTSDVEEPVAQPAQEEPAKAQPSVEEPALEEQDVEMPAQAEPTVEKKEKPEEPTPGAEIKSKTTSDSHDIEEPFFEETGVETPIEEERLGTYIPLPSDEKLKSATIKTHTFRLKEIQNNNFMKVISLAPEVNNGAGKTTIIKILTGKPMVNRPMRTATFTQLFLEKGQLETATQLGGGQHQRVAIARLLFPKFA